MQQALIIFVKYPRPGFVKTRLSNKIGKKDAACIYSLFASSILSQVKSNSFQTFIFYSPYNQKKKIEKWIGGNYHFLPQKGKTLGERMFNAFSKVFEQGAKHAVIIGTDSPLLSSSIVLSAFKKLRTYQAVIGPATDGGYYLLGLSSLEREIFSRMRWSTDKVFEQTIDRFKKIKLKYSVLDKKSDVDTFEDLLCLQRKLSQKNKLINKELIRLKKYTQTVISRVKSK